MTPAELIVIGASVYLIAGTLFSVYFVLLGVTRLDPGAAGSHWAFRVFIFPGSAALWPWLLLRLCRSATSASTPAHAPNAGGPHA
ncbi:MAG: hypothetical protein AB7O77_04765 [Phycisphaerales bacterium]